MCQVETGTGQVDQFLPLRSAVEPTIALSMSVKVLSTGLSVHESHEAIVRVFDIAQCALKLGKKTDLSTLHEKEGS